MNYDDAVEYSDAMEWLIDHYAEFPTQVPGGAENLSRNVSGRMFKNWRWVLTIDDEIIFANCIQECISKIDFDMHRSALLV